MGHVFDQDRRLIFNDVVDHQLGVHDGERLTTTCHIDGNPSGGDTQHVAMAFRLAVFNVLAHNRDDHARNIAFLMDERGTWSFAPAFDLTFSHGPGGEQSMVMAGQGKDPSIEDLMRLTDQAGLESCCAAQVIEKVQSALAQWPNLAKAHGLDRALIGRVKAALQV